jgi:hypothetical protein
MLSGLAILLGASSLFLAGCGANGSLTGPINPGGNEGTITGQLYGGQSPVIGATVQLYAAGTGGYGSAPTPLGAPVTTQAPGGTFSIGSYTCPAAPGDLTFLLATGGNPGSGTNNQLTQIAALGSCNASGFTNQFVFMDEVTTVASAYSLAQFISYTSGVTGQFPTTSPSFGTVPFIGIPTSGPSCNAANNWLSTGANTCNYLGLQNAMTTVQNLVCYANGVAPPDSIPYNYYTGGTCATGHGDTSAGHTGYAPSTRINTIANFVSACVNSTGGVSGDTSNCGKLFKAVKPTPAPPFQTAGTPAAVTDTLQAVWYLALYPQTNATNGLALINLVPATPPFLAPASMTAAPPDWTLAVGYTGGGFVNANIVPSGKSSSYANGLAIDQQGNLWAASAADNGHTSHGAIVGFNNQGTPLSPATSAAGWGGFANTTSATNAPFQPAVDVNGNIYFVNTGVSPGSLTKINSGGSVLLHQTLTDAPVGALPVGIALDPSNDIWVLGFPAATGIGAGAGVQEYSSTGAPLTSYEDDSQPAVGYNGLVLDNLGNPWATNPSTQFAWFDTGAGDIQLYASGSSAGTVANAYGGSSNEGQLSVNSTGDVYGCNSANIFEDDPIGLVTNTISAVNGCNTGANFAPNAFDGKGNLWEPVVSSSLGHLVEVAASPVGSEVLGNAISPTTGYEGIGGAGEPAINLLTHGSTNSQAMTGTAVDASGNVWVLNGQALHGVSDHQLVEFVGLAAPTVTPTVLAVQNNTFTTLP